MNLQAKEMDLLLQIIMLHDMLHTIRRALHYYHQKDIRQDLMLAGMKGDYSWEQSAHRYVDLYQSIA